MKKLKRTWHVFGLLVSLTTLSGISGCDDEGQDIQNWVENTSKLRATAKEQGNIVPYQQQQYQALKAYFVEINEIALALENDANFALRFNNAVAKADINVICAKVLFTRSEWQDLVERCTRNNFFLCAEEVRAFPDMVGTLRGRLVPEQQMRFDQTPSCQAALGSN